MKKTNLDELIEQEIQNDPSLLTRINRIGQAINVAIQIYSIRKQRNLTQAQLASVAHVRQSNIARLENADYEGYSKKTLEKIANALDVDLAIFLIPKERVSDINTMLDIANVNQTSYARFPGMCSDWISNATSVYNGLIKKEKDDCNDEIIDISGNGGELKVSEHLFNFI